MRQLGSSIDLKFNTIRLDGVTVAMATKGHLNEDNANNHWCNLQEKQNAVEITIEQTIP